MSVYICSICDKWADDDYDPAGEDPNDPCGCICGDCQCEIEEQDDE